MGRKRRLTPKQVREARKASEPELARKQAALDAQGTSILNQTARLDSHDLSLTALQNFQVNANARLDSHDDSLVSLANAIAGKVDLSAAQNVPGAKNFTILRIIGDAGGIVRIRFNPTQGLYGE